MIQNGSLWKFQLKQTHNEHWNTCYPKQNHKTFFTFKTWSWTHFKHIHFYLDVQISQLNLNNFYSNLFYLFKPHLAIVLGLMDAYTKAPLHFGYFTISNPNRPWWPSGLGRVSNSSRHSLEDPGLNPCSGLHYWSLRSRKNFVAIQIAGRRVTSVAYDIEPSVDAIRHDQSARALH